MARAGSASSNRASRPRTILFLMPMRIAGSSRIERNDGMVPVTGVYCNQCGHRNPVGSNFCSSCGAVLEHSGEDEATTITFLPVEQAGEVGEEEITVTL